MIEWARPQLITRGLQAAYDMRSPGALAIPDVGTGDYPAVLSAQSVATLDSAGIVHGASRHVNLQVERMGSMGLFAANTEAWTLMHVAGNLSLNTMFSRCGAGATGTRQFTLAYSSGNVLLYLRGTETTMVVTIGLGWHCYTVRWDGAAAMFKLDMAANQTKTVGAAAEETGFRMIIGARNNGATALMTGTTSYSALYDVALDDGEIAGNYRVLQGMMNARGLMLP